MTACPVSADARKSALEASVLSPVTFAEDEGRWGREAFYGLEGRGVRMFFANSGTSFQISGSEKVQGKPEAESSLNKEDR